MAARGLFTAHTSTAPGVSHHPDVKQGSEGGQTGWGASSRLCEGDRQRGQSRGLAARLLPGQGSRRDRLPQSAGRAGDTWGQARGPLRAEGRERTHPFISFQIPAVSASALLLFLKGQEEKRSLPFQKQKAQEPR